MAEDNFRDGNSANFWSRRTTQQKKVILITGTLTAVLVIIAIVCVAVLTGSSSSEAKSLDARRCITNSCNESATQITNLMDDRYDPCNNLFSFACGRFVSSSAEDTSFMGDAINHLILQVKEMLQNTKPENEKNAAVKSTARLFNLCQNHENVDKNGLDTIRNLIRETLAADWPMAVGKRWSGFDWSRSLARAIRMDPKFILNIMIIPDPDDVTKLVPMLSFQPPEFEMPGRLRDIVCKVLPNCSSNAILDQEINNITSSDKDTSFYSGREPMNTEENKLPVILRSSTYEVQKIKKYGISDLTSQLPEVNWQGFFETLFSGTGAKIDSKFKVVTQLPLMKYILSSLHGDKRMVANVIALSVLKQWGPRYSSQLRAAITPTLDRNLTCSTFISDILGYAVGYMYLKKRMPSDTISEAMLVTMKLRDGFRKLIVDSTWLDNQTQKKALKKVDKIRSNVAVPPWVLNGDMLAKYYKKIDVDSRKGFAVVSRLAMDNFNEQIYGQVNKPVNKTNYWPITSPVMTNAFYFAMGNSMYYPLGIIKTPFFTPGRPRAVRFGAFGYIAGHELTHGFDSNGKDYDENGQINDWWTPETAKKFQKGAKCFIDQYSGIRDNQTGLQLNGTLNLAENIADNGGVKAAYLAFKDSSKEPQYVLNGLERYTEDQIFFITAAQSWCAKFSPNTMKNRIFTDTHAPDMYRAIVPFQNNPEFSKAFNCKTGSFMNPKSKCTIW